MPVKKELDKANNSNFYKENLWSTPLKIYTLREGIESIPSNEFNKETTKFLNNCFDFKSIFTHFIILLKLNMRNIIVQKMKLTFA